MIPFQYVFMIAGGCADIQLWATQFLMRKSQKNVKRGATCRLRDYKKLSWCRQTRATRLEVNQGHQTVAFHMLGIVSSCEIVTLSLRRVVFTIFDFKKMLWPWNRGQRSLKIIESGTIRKIVYGYPLMFFSNIVPITHSFWDIQLQNCRDLENRVMGPSRSLELSPCDRAHMTFYWRSIVTMALSRVVSEIFNVEKCRDIETGVRGYSRSLKKVPFYTPVMVSY